MTQVTARHRLIDAAIEAFAEKGFHGTTTRDIASRAGMSPAALYVHHASKESLLFTLSSEGHRAARDMMLAASQSTREPVERLRTLVYEFTYWHALHSRRARIVQYELAALDVEHLEVIAGFRRDIDQIIRDAIGDGVTAGVFEVGDIPGTALALMSLGVDLVRWFQPEGPRTPEQIGTLYAELGLRMVGHSVRAR